LRGHRALPLRIGVIALLLLELLGGNLAQRACAEPPSPTVSASPPKEAVPAPPVTSALQRHIQQCNASAQAKQLYGKRREAYVRSCVAAHPRVNATHPLTAATGHSASGSAGSTSSTRSGASTSSTPGH
jgi:psiF repeat